MKSVILNPFTPIPKSTRSHVRGWAMIWAQRLNADIVGKDWKCGHQRPQNIYIEHGVNFSGSLNLFGGFDDEVYDRCVDLMDMIKAGSTVYSLDLVIDYCNYPEQIEKRIGAETTSDWVDEKFVTEFQSLLSRCRTKTMATMESNKIIIGDSHSVAYSMRNQMVKKINGQLLWSALKMGLPKFIKKNCFDTFNDLEEVTLCLGSIDMRFHVCKEDRMKPKEYAKVYADAVIKAQQELQIPIRVCAPVPIEHEERKIPKTGQYKGQNFFGDRTERWSYTMRFIEELEDNFVDFAVVSPPKDWYYMDGDEYADKIMEMNSSVHIAPENYNSILGWKDV